MFEADGRTHRGPGLKEIFAGMLRVILIESSVYFFIKKQSHNIQYDATASIFPRNT
jgi:hypothetical protein